MPFVDLETARRIESAASAAAVDSVRKLARIRPKSGAAFEEIAGGHVVFVEPGSPLNHAFGIGLHGPVADGDLDRLETFWRSRRQPAQVDLCPLAELSLVAQLANRGYRLGELENVLVLGLGSPRFPRAAPDVEVSNAAPGEADLWVRTVLAGFAGAPGAPPEAGEPLRALFESPAATCVLARIRGEPAGGGAMAAYDEVALLFSSSTLPPFRRRGVHTALLSARLLRAIESGCDLAVTSTLHGSGSQRNAERFGFRPAYTRVTLLRD
jgi:GNAT superfamily N-acetyltransferase